MIISSHDTRPVSIAHSTSHQNRSGLAATRRVQINKWIAFIIADYILLATTIITVASASSSSSVPTSPKVTLRHSYQSITPRRAGTPIECNRSIKTIRSHRESSSSSPPPLPIIATSWQPHHRQRDRMGQFGE